MLDHGDRIDAGPACRQRPGRREGGVRTHAPHQRPRRVRTSSASALRARSLPSSSPRTRRGGSSAGNRMAQRTPKRAHSPGGGNAVASIAQSRRTTAVATLSLSFDLADAGVKCCRHLALATRMHLSSRRHQSSELEAAEQPHAGGGAVNDLCGEPEQRRQPSRQQHAGPEQPRSIAEAPIIRRVPQRRMAAPSPDKECGQGAESARSHAAREAGGCACDICNPRTRVRRYGAHSGSSTNFGPT